MRTLRQLMLGIALVCGLGMCATSLPTSNKVDVDNFNSDPIVKTVEESPDGFGTGLAYVDHFQVYPSHIDSVTTFKLATNDQKLLQIVHLRDGTNLQYTRYLSIKNLIYRDLYAEYRDRWDQEEFNKHRLRVMEKEIISYDLHEIYMRTTWNYFNEFLTQCGELGIHYDSFKLSILNQVDKDEILSPNLVKRWRQDNNLTQKDILLITVCIFGLFLMGIVIGLLSSWASRKLKGTGPR